MSLFETAKSLGAIAQKLGDLDLRQKLLDMQSDALELMEQLKEKDAKIELLEKALALKKKLVRRGAAYYVADDAGEIVDGPFCTKCFDVEHIVCRLVQVRFQGGDTVQCQKCRVQFRCPTTFNMIHTLRN